MEQVFKKTIIHRFLNDYAPFPTCPQIVSYLFDGETYRAT